MYDGGPIRSPEGGYDMILPRGSEDYATLFVYDPLTFLRMAPGWGAGWEEAAVAFAANGIGVFQPAPDRTIYVMLFSDDPQRRTYET